MEPRLSNDTWERLNLRWQAEARLGVIEPADYSGPAPIVVEVSCDVCGRTTTSATHLCPRCRDVMEDEDRRFGVVFGGPILGEPDDD